MGPGLISISTLRIRRSEERNLGDLEIINKEEGARCREGEHGGFEK
jgi:hypothetical protein